MVNLIAVLKPLLHLLMKKAAIKPHTIEIEPGTVMNFWVPSETIKKAPKTSSLTSTTQPQITKPKPTKPVVVLLHGFAADGIVTWLFQVGALTKKYSVYIPDLLFFGGSTTESLNRSPNFQAECVVKGLRMLGIERCTVVAYSYGGMVAFKMAEMYPELVEAVVVSGAVVAMTDCISNEMLERLGFTSFAQFLLPNNVKECKALLRVATWKKFWFPDCLHKDFLEDMFTNTKERVELLEGLIVSNKDISIPIFSQRIHLLWGEKDEIFKVEDAEKLKEQLGDKTTFEVIKKAGHLVHLERPCVYNRGLNKFLASVHADNKFHSKK